MRTKIGDLILHNSYPIANTFDSSF